MKRRQTQRRPGGAPRQGAGSTAMDLDLNDRRPAEYKPLSRHSYLISQARPLGAILVLLLALGASGCELLGLDDPAASEPEEAQQNEPPPPPPEESEPEEEPQVELEPDYERPDYPGQVRRNPFLPDMNIVRPTRNVEDSDVRAKDPLEKYSLSQLSLVAIISEVAVPKAMLLDPEGFGHVIKEGDRIGLNGGTVSDIYDNEVEIREISEGLKTETRLTTLKLRVDELGRRSDDALSEEEREALQRLLESEQGREAARERLQQDEASGSSEQNAPAPQGQNAAVPPGLQR